MRRLLFAVLLVLVFPAVAVANTTLEDSALQLRPAIDDLGIKVKDLIHCMEVTPLPDPDWQSPRTVTVSKRWLSSRYDIATSAKKGSFTFVVSHQGRVALLEAVKVSNLQGAVTGTTDSDKRWVLFLFVTRECVGRK